jgi:putative GTP pyrophosphokinase
MSDTRTDSTWKKNPEIIKDFLEQKNDYEQLCAEIAYILKKKFAAVNIEVSSVSYRAKTLKSFLEKIERKTYENPFEELTDFAGVRVVYLYQNDLPEIESIIKKEFMILEKVDKLNDKGIDKFGYGAVHYIVKLGKNSSGARYDDLKDLVCEIQVRTVLQDAWAIIDHHLVYKRESEIPSSILRKLNSLAGLFETADSQFDAIRKEREHYLAELDKSKETKDFLKNEFNLDSFNSYLSWKFPKMSAMFFEPQVEIVFKDISKLGFKTLEDLDKIISKYKKSIPSIIRKIEAAFADTYFANHKLSSSLLVSTVLQIDNSQYLEEASIPPNVRAFVKSNFNKRV